MITKETMKRLYMIAVVLAMAMSATSQPKWVKKASKSVFTLKTFKADGTLVGSSCGFYVSDKGDALSSFSPFKGAHHAVVIDASGKEQTVESILGANTTYDVVKFKVATEKTTPLVIATNKLAVGSQAWLLSYRNEKQVTQGVIRKTEVFNDNYTYYTIGLQMTDNQVGAPLLNSEGEVIAIMQQPASTSDTLNYAASIDFANSLKVSGLSLNDPTYRSTEVRKALPQDVDQAVLTLYFASSALDSAAYAQLIDDFIVKFPNHPDGYTSRAQLLANGNQFAEADKDMEKALKVAEKADEVHYTYSRLILQKELYRSEVGYEPWSLDRAYDEAGEAYNISPQPIYRQQQAIVRYAQKRYEEAYNLYEGLFNSSLRSAETFYAASVCKEMQQDTTQQLALLDSCVAMFSKPYLKTVAPYLLKRAQLLTEMGQYRSAVNDLNEYESLMKSHLNSSFYFMRYRAELGGRLFQQALNDIDQAIVMTPQSDLYYAEKASLLVRVGLYDDAIETARKCIEIAPDHSDGYLFLGLSQCLKGQKDEGTKNLRKAGELGDPQAEELIEKYSK